MQIRWTGDGLKAGQVAEVEDAVGQAYIAAGKAVPVEMQGAVAEVKETPEQPVRTETMPVDPAPVPETR
jgi:hypothetical protein